MDRNRGVTLIEMLVVLVIIGLVATLTTLGVNAAITSSKQKAARVQIDTLASSVTQFKLEQNRYPASLAELEKDPGNLRSPFPQGGYLQTKGVPLDPWDRPFEYAVGGEDGFTITCLGENGISGGDGADKDLSTADPVGQK